MLPAIKGKAKDKSKSAVLHGQFNRKRSVSPQDNLKILFSLENHQKQFLKLDSDRLHKKIRKFLPTNSSNSELYRQRIAVQQYDRAHRGDITLPLSIEKPSRTLDCLHAPIKPVVRSPRPTIRFRRDTYFQKDSLSEFQTVLWDIRNKGDTLCSESGMLLKITEEASRKFSQDFESIAENSILLLEDQAPKSEWQDTLKEVIFAGKKQPKGSSRK